MVSSNNVNFHPLPSDLIIDNNSGAIDIEVAICRATDGQIEIATSQTRGC